MKDKLFNIVKLNDLHIPFEDYRAVEVAIQFCKDLQPDIIITDEWMDFYELSRFIKDPSMSTGYTLHEARETTWKWFKLLYKACPNARRVHLSANHTKRLGKYLHRNARELCGLPEFQFETFMQLDKFNIEYMQYFVFRKFLFKHGDKIHKFSGYTAKNEFEKEGMSGASGHSHRLAQHYRTRRGGRYTWIECGCLCRMDMDYCEGQIMDWQLGIGLVQFLDNTHHYIAHALPITDYQIIWGG